MVIETSSVATTVLAAVDGSAVVCFVVVAATEMPVTAVVLIFTVTVAVPTSSSHALIESISYPKIESS